jgi:hypothetical protein
MELRRSSSTVRLVGTLTGFLQPSHFILKCPGAVATSVYVVRVFARLRNELLTNATLEKRLADIERTLTAHDGELREFYEKIRPLLPPPPEPPKRPIGFHTA